MTPRNRTWRLISELTHGGWVVVVLFVCLAASQLLVSHFYGAGWGFVAAIGALAIWLIIRPWRFGLLSPDSRREVLIFGTLGIISWVLRTAVVFWRIGT